MNPINYNDIFDFRDASEVQKFLAAVQEMQKELGELQRVSIATARESAKAMREQAAEAAAASKKVTTATAEELKLLTAKAEALRKANQQAKDDNKTSSEQAQTLGQLRKALSALKAEYDVNSQNAAKMDAEIRKTTNAIKQNEQAIKQAATEQEKANTIDLRALRTYNEKSQALNNLRARYKQLNPEIASQRVEMEKLLVKIKLLDTQLKKTDSSLGNFQRNVGNYKSALADFVSTIPGGSTFAPFLAGAGGAAAAAGVLAAAIAAAFAGIGKAEAAILQFKRFENGIKAVSNSATEASINIAFLYEEANKLGLTVDSLQGGFVAFMAATKGTALEGEKARDVFAAVSNAAAKLGIGSEATKRALNALGQMMSKGTVSSEELKQQLGDALPGAFNLMAKALNVTTKELGKMLKDGEVLAADALPKLAKVLREEFGSAYIDTLEANKNRLSNATDAFWTTIGKRLEPALNSWYDTMADWVKRVNKLMQTTEEQVGGQMPQLLDAYKGKSKEEIKALIAEADKQAKEYAAQLDRIQKGIPDPNARPESQGGTFDEKFGRFINRTFNKDDGLESLKRFQLVNEAAVKAGQEALREMEKAEENSAKAIADTKKAAAEKSREERAKEAEDRRAELKKLTEALEKDLQEINERLNLQLNVKLTGDAEDFKKLMAGPTRLGNVASVDGELPEETAAPAFSLFNLSSGELEQTDNFLEFQRQVIDNNQFIAQGFAAVGRSITQIFGQNPFSEFLEQGVAAYQAFLRIQELQIGLRQRDTAATQVQTLAQSKLVTTQAVGAVTATASQTGVGALVTVPAVLALLASAIGLARNLFKFEEGTEFVPKQRPEDPLGKDSVYAMLAPGERVVPTKLNKELAGVSNEELVKFAQIGMLQGEGLKDAGGRTVLAVGNGIDEGRLAAAMAQELRTLPISVNQWDEAGYHQHTTTRARLKAVNKKWFA